MKAMVLAAGFGTRLRPYTLARPKPLFPVLDRPLLLRILAQLREAGATSIVVNAHHLREQITALLADEPGVTVQLEKIELGTGGGLRLARRHFGEEPFLTVNGDIVHDIDLRAVFARHRDSRASVTMVLHDCPRFNNVLVSSDGRIIGFGDKARDDERLLAFTGIQVIEPAVLEAMPEGVFWNIIDCWRDLLARGGRIQAMVVSGHYWTDMGTPADYLALHQAILKEGRMTAWLDGQPQPIQISKTARLDAGAACEDWAVIGAGARIGAGSLLSRTVVWDNAEVPPHSVLADTIVA
ncbi:MAG: sugar phosphate nucleotidyltransferase [Thermodesulfobacteriota bacterium]